MSAAVLTRSNKALDSDTDERALCPYVGLVPFSEKDREFFFGRVEESKNIAANLRATRLTLLYGPSGVGKSSILSAGVVAPLKRIAQEDLVVRGAPDFAVVLISEWSDPLNRLVQHIRDSVRSALGQSTIGNLPSKLSLREVIRAWTERYGIELLIILDQFEDYFLYNADEDGPGTFAHEFPEAVNDLNLSVRFLISMRDDMLAKLDRFKGSIPLLFDNRLQIEHLDLAAAYEAIVEPVKKYNRVYAKDNPFSFDREFALKEEAFERELVAESSSFLIPRVLSDLEVGKMSVGITGQGVVKRDESDSTPGASFPKVSIEAPYLQLVMKSIWHHDETTRTRELTAGTLKKLGGSKKIVEQYLDKIMERLSEQHQDAAAAVFYYLVTPSGTKIAHTVKSLAAYTKLGKKLIQDLVKTLLKVREDNEDHRILRRVNQRVGKDIVDAYEVHHDALAPAALAWSAKHKSEQDKKRALEREIKKQKRIVLWGVVILAVAFIVGLVIYFIQRDHIRREEELAVNLTSLKNATDSKIKSYNETIRSLVVLMDPTSDDTGLAVAALQREIDAGEIDKELKPLILPILKQVAEREKDTQTGKAAAEAASRISQNVQDTRISPRVYIQIQDESQRNLARHLLEQLNQRELKDIPDVRSKIIAPGIQNVGTRKTIEVSELRYFHKTDLERKIGEQLIQILKAAGLTEVELKQIGGYEDSANIRPNHFELWLSTDAL